RLEERFQCMLLDLKEPRAEFERCIGKIDMVVNPENPDQARSAQNQQETAACRKKAKGVWNSTGLVIAGAPAWISTDGSTSSLKPNGGGYWAAFGYGLGTWGQVVFDARRQTGQSI